MRSELPVQNDSHSHTHKQHVKHSVRYAGVMALNNLENDAHLGVSASVHSGNLTCGGKSHRVHSKHGVKPGMMTRACPLKPSVPPSTNGLIVARSGLPSES